MENLQFLVTGQDNAPWIGYYTHFNGAKLAISNFLGIWFEIRRCKGKFEAFRVACSALNLKSHPLPGTNIVALMESSERLPLTHPGSPAKSIISQLKEIELMPYIGKGKETELKVLLRRSKSSRMAQVGTDMDLPNPDLYLRIMHLYRLAQIWILYCGYLQINGYKWINSPKFLFI
jgi:hypothetical protein